MTDADKVMNPQHFGSDLADIRIRIGINPEIQIQTPDHFRLKLDALAEVCALWAQLGYKLIITLFLLFTLRPYSIYIETCMLGYMF